MLDKLFSRVFGSYKSTITGIVITVIQSAAMVFVNGGGTFDNKTFLLTAIPAVVGALQKDAPA